MLTSKIVLIAAAAAASLFGVVYVSARRLGTCLAKALGEGLVAGFRAMGDSEDEFEIETRTITEDEALAALMDGAAHVNMAALEALARGDDPVDPTRVYVTYPDEDEIVIEG